MKLPLQYAICAPSEKSLSFPQETDISPLDRNVVEIKPDEWTFTLAFDFPN